ncbi:ActS/PrrB/RegB family redox-sensitive histidine kinase [Alphaproteobacteria bacterium]|nr:ActS/PrrB/RegB family redox-sensitive histidine kinase [Alphaproteobacteria bacterium]
MTDHHFLPAFETEYSLIDPRVSIFIRWVALSGQLTTVLIVHFALGFLLPLVPLLTIIAIGIILNLWQSWLNKNAVQLSRLSVLFVLIFDVTQLAALLYFAGGLLNPFSILFLAPVAVSAAILDVFSTITLVIIVTICASILSIYHLPLPWSNKGFVVPPLYQFGLWIALVISAIFMAYYVFWLAQKSKRTSEMLGQTRLMLASERQVIALGSLATAAAHKLGSPLTTIRLISDDLMAQLKLNSIQKEDLLLLKAEVERCQIILSELDSDAMKTSRELDILMPLGLAIQKMVANTISSSKVQIEWKVENSSDKKQPEIAQIPELSYALEAILENAIDFAETKITLVISWDQESIYINVIDDGMGYPTSVLSNIGQPENSSRLGQEGHRGLGLFLVQSFIRQLNGTTIFQNRKPNGASVKIKIPIESLV